MAAYPTEMFIYDKIFFENGRKDQIEHPVVIAGVDEENAYCFVMTSQTKNNEKIFQARNIYNSNIKYIEAIPNINCQTNDNIRSLINTTNCIQIPLTETTNYQTFGYIAPNLLKEITIRWLFQQNQINDKKQYNFNEICTSLGVDSSMLYSPLYKQCEQLMQEYPDELQLQREYAHDLRVYKDECTKIRRQNTNNFYRGAPPIPYPKDPILKTNQSINQYEVEQEERIKNSPFVGLKDKLFDSTESKFVDFEKRKNDKLELMEMFQEQKNEQEVQYGKNIA